MFKEHPGTFARLSLTWGAFWIGFGSLAAVQGWALDAVARPETSLGLEQWFGFMLPDWVPWVFLTPLVLVAAHRFPLSRDALWSRVATHLLAGVTILLVHSVAATTIATGLGTSMPTGAGFAAAWAFQLARQSLVTLLVYGTVVGVETARLRQTRLSQQRLRESHLETELAHARLQALENQLHPHFLFNSLQAIGTLIKPDPDRSARLLALVGDLLRISLNHDGRPGVTVKEEVEHLEVYLEIEKLRLGSRLVTRVDVDDRALDASIPRFVLQPLVENAVRYGVERNPGEGRIAVSIAIRSGEMEIVVADNGESTETIPPGTWTEGTGLGTTRRRLEAFYGIADPLKVERGETGGVIVTLTLPFVEGDLPHATPEPSGGRP